MKEREEKDQLKEREEKDQLKEREEKEALEWLIKREVEEVLDVVEEEVDVVEEGGGKSPMTADGGAGVGKYPTLLLIFIIYNIQTLIN